MSRRTSAAQSLAHHVAAVDMAMDQTPDTAHLTMDTITRLPPLAMPSPQHHQTTRGLYERF
jgi:hypothetical protein